ncbi:MAG: hypothetical protein AAF645_09275, partial [Myxococcota bacterium]
MSRCWLLASFLVLTTLHTAQAQRAESIPVGSVQQVLDPMDGFGLAGRRAHTAIGFLALVRSSRRPHVFDGFLGPAYGLNKIVRIVRTKKTTINNAQL